MPRRLSRGGPRQESQGTHLGEGDRRTAVRRCLSLRVHPEGSIAVSPMATN